MTVPYRDRPTGSAAKLNTIWDGTKVLKTIVNLHRNYKSYSFFGIISAVLLALAAGFIIPV